SCFLRIHLLHYYLFTTFFLFYCAGHHRDLHSFPTRRSSDLPGAFGGSAIEFAVRLDHEGSAATVDRAPHQLMPDKLRGSVRAIADRKSTRLNSSHDQISYAVFCLKKKRKTNMSTHYDST